MKVRCNGARRKEDEDEDAGQEGESFIKYPMSSFLSSIGLPLGLPQDEGGFQFREQVGGGKGGGGKGGGGGGGGGGSR